MQFTFNKQELENYSTDIHREWALTNGIGGYAGSSVLGAHNRTHQGYLIASLHPPKRNSGMQIRIVFLM